MRSLIAGALIAAIFCAGGAFAQPPPPVPGTVWWSINTTLFTSLSNGWTARGVAVIYDSATTTLLAINPMNITNNFMWTVASIAQFPLPVADQMSGMIFAVNTNGQLVAIHLLSGGTAWTTPSSVGAENSEGQELAVVGKNVIIVTSNGKIMGFDAHSGAKTLSYADRIWTPSTAIRLHGIDSSKFFVSAFGVGFGTYIVLTDSKGNASVKRLWIQDAGNATNVRFYPAVSNSLKYIAVCGKYFNSSSNYLDWWVAVYAVTSGERLFREWLQGGNIYQGDPPSIQSAPMFTAGDAKLVVTYYSGHSFINSGFYAFDMANSSQMTSSWNSETTSSPVLGKNAYGVASYAYGTYDGLQGMLPRSTYVEAGVWSATLGAQVFHRPLFVSELSVFIGWGSMQMDLSSSQILAVFC